MYTRSSTHHQQPANRSTAEPRQISDLDASTARLELLSRNDLRTLGIRASNPTPLVWEADGKFPKRLTISSAKVAWLRSEVIGWIEKKAAARG